MKVKVCGITRYDDARTALDAGAWALGFIFHPPSPRFIDQDRAREIVSRLPAETRTVGVFVDRPSADVQATVDHVGLSGVQLHGNETPETLAVLKADPRVKAFRVREGAGEVARLEALFSGFPDALILLDTYRKDAHGGTGETFDWQVARGLAAGRPIVLAGGLTLENVEEAVEVVQPFALDVSSGLETSPGVKDPERIRELFRVLGKS